MSAETWAQRDQRVIPVERAYFKVGVLVGFTAVAAASALLVGLVHLLNRALREVHQ